MKSRLRNIVFALLIVAPLGAKAQTDTSALILSLQKQILQLLTQIQSLQKEVAELKTETGIQALPISPLSPLSPLPPISEEEAELPEFTRSLSLGTRGDDVRKLQGFLARDKDIYPEGLATGFYGPRTVEAVKRWQRKNNVEAVGTVGPKTIARFRELGQGIVRGLMEQGAGRSDARPPGLDTAPGIQPPSGASLAKGGRQMATTTPMVIPPMMATSAPVMATTTPAIPAEPAISAQPAVPGVTSTVPATPAAPAQPASPSTTASNELKVTYPNGGETWYKGNSYTITWQNPLAGGFTGQEKYYWNVLLKRGNTAWQADGTVPVTQSSYTWSKWTGWAEPIPNAEDFKVGISLVDTCAAQVSGVCPSANISITPAGGIDYSDGYFTATATPPAATSTQPTPLTCVSPYHVATSDNRCVWSCGAGTQPDDPNNINGQCVCKSGYTETGTDQLRRRVCTQTTTATTTTSTTDTTPPTITLAVGYPNLTAQTQPIYVGFNADEEVKVVYEYGLTASYGSTLNVWDNYWTGNGIYLPTLSQGTIYHIRAKATDRAGNIGYSQDYTFTTASDTTAGPPSAPGNLTTSLDTYKSVRLSWQDTSNNETNFKVQRRTAGGNWESVAQPTANTASYSEYLPSSDENTYDYMVSGCNNSGCADSNITTITLGAPKPATNLTAAVSGSTVNLSWTDNSNIETQYSVSRRLPGISTSYVYLATLSPNATSYSESNVSPATYEYLINVCTYYSTLRNNVCKPPTITTVTVSEPTTATTTSAALNSLSGLLIKLQEFLRRR